ncbi:MAG: hypothetical protein ACYDHY_07645 [Acidiferrobacterales bacterium]
MAKLNEIFKIQEAPSPSQKHTLQLTVVELEALEHAVLYAMDHDDDGIRSSEPEAEARTEALDHILQLISPMIGIPERG